jgi:hypothetical protein
MSLFGCAGWMLAGMVFGLQWAGSPAWAQTKTTIKVPAPPAHETYVQHLERLYQKAGRDLERSEKNLKSEKDKGYGFDACVVNRLEAETENARWFRAHRADIENHYRNLEGALQQVFQRLNVEPIRVPTKPPQEQREIPVSIQTVLNFIKLSNERLKSCSPEGLAELRRRFDDPGANSICDASGNKVGVAFSQVKSALAQMVTNLNASLKERDENFRLGILETEAGFDLKLVLNLKGSDGADQKLEVSLLEAFRRADGSMTILEAQKWHVILGSRTRIAGRAIEGRERFLEFIWEKRGLCPNLISMGAFRGVARLRPRGEPLKVYEDFTGVMAWGEWKKYLKDDGIAPESMSRAAMRVEFQAASDCVKTVFQIYHGFGYPGVDDGFNSYAWLCGETDRSPAEGKGESADYVAWLVQALGVGIGDQDVLTQGSMDNCLGRVAIASAVKGGHFNSNLDWLCGISRHSPVAAYQSNEAYISCLEWKILAGEKETDNLLACKEECGK